MDSAYFRVPMEEFNKALWDRYHNGKIRNVYPFIKYNDIMEKIKAMVANPPCNSPGEYYLLRKFIVVDINGKERLSCKPDSNSENTHELNNTPKYYVALEEIYGFLDDAHKFIKHGCRDRLVRRMQSQGIVNITRETAELFLSFCKLCRPRRNLAPRRIAMKSPLPHSSPDHDYNDETACDREISNVRTIMNSSDSNSVDAVVNNSPPHTLCTFTRGFVDFLDFSSTPDGDYRYACLYIDIQTCFCVLHPIRCKCVTEMTSHLLNMFSLLGPPQVLHSNFSSSLLHSLIEELKQALPGIVLVSGSQNYSELQEVARNCISEVDCMLKLWMLENNTSNWSRGLKIIQLQKNTKLPHSGSKSPYECFFGHALNSNLPLAIELPGLRSAVKEDQLLRLLNEHVSPEPYEHLQVSLDPKICKMVHTQNRSNMQSFESISSDHVVKMEPPSPKKSPETNGHELSDSSNEVPASPNVFKHKKRCQFLRDFGTDLVKEEEWCSVPCLPQRLKENPDSKSEEPVTKKQKVIERKRCYICPKSKDRKSKKSCTKCERNICGDHSVITCTNCT